jgi:ketosteroid isomerase-like protein
MTLSAESEVRRTAARLVAAFGEHRVDDYFACFDEAATFIFHNVPTRLASREEYRSLWERWEKQDGFRVHACRSSEADVRVVGDVAVFTHDVSTDLETQGTRETVLERETIVFARQVDDRWVAVHEHLSPRPAGADD